jgi:hypothetical protein
VERVTVDLDHSPPSTPQEIDLIAVEPRVDLRLG